MKDFIFVDKVFCEIAQYEQDHGLDSLNYNQKVVLWVWHSMGLINNGGLQNFIAWDEVDEEIVGMFKKLNLDEISNIMEEFFLLFPEIDESFTSKQREELLTSKINSIEPTIREYNSKIWDSKKNIVNELMKFIINENVKVG